MSGYGLFSKYYDKLNEDIDYKGRAGYLRGLFSRFESEPTLLLDLACGTGGFTFEFLKQGIDVIAVDPSEEMLGIAREKAAEQGVNPLFLCQSGAELDLYGTVDGAVCCLDSINHITDREELEETFKKVSLFLEPGKLFIFDVNTVYKHENILADNTFVRESDDMFFVWQNSYDEEEKITDIYLDFFLKKGDNYIRESEDFSERAYSDEELTALLEKAGFRVEAIFGDMSEEAPAADSERNIFVARKVN
ncbi:MAG: class I SAM-dependent methyltransferase [Clostridia bacterium]|nr:class I SAM-dependent methyltransferase [Clostridia bacterium]